jgi:hypothetical protein
MLTRILDGVVRRVDARAPSLRSRVSPGERRRRRSTLQHPVGLRRPRAPAVLVADKSPEAEDVAIAERLLAAYRAAAPAAGPFAGLREDLWSDIARRQAGFAAVLERGDGVELAAYLCNVSRRDAAEGVSQGAGEYERLTRDRTYRDHLALMAKDKLVSLAEAVGAIAVENPEQGIYGASLYRDAGELVLRIGEHLGIDVTPPDIDGGLLKLDTGRGLFGERDANAIYTAWLLRRVGAGAGCRICEIGGGTGRVAYWSRRLGSGPYTIIDLPQVNVIQGYYALRTLPAEDVVLYGEPRSGAGVGGLEILPAHAIAELREPDFDLVLNQDSFPEMDAQTVDEYLRWILATCTGSLVSINHESKPPRPDGVEMVSVPEAIDRVRGLELVQRWPYWLRRGYVLELYRPNA